MTPTWPGPWARGPSRGPPTPAPPGSSSATGSGAAACRTRRWSGTPWMPARPPTRRRSPSTSPEPAPPVEVDTPGHARRRVLYSRRRGQRWPAARGSPDRTPRRVRSGVSHAPESAWPEPRSLWKTRTAGERGRRRAVGASGGTRPRLARTVADDTRPYPRAPRAVNAAPQHRPRHAPTPCPPAPGPAIAWVAVLALAGFALHPGARRPGRASWSPSRWPRPSPAPCR